MKVVDRIKLNRIVGERVRSLRLARGLSQNKLAMSLGVTYQQVQKYESGRDRIAVSTLVEIALTLGAPILSFIPPEKSFTK